jgi:AAA domain
MTIDRQDTDNGTFYGCKFGSMSEVRHASAEAPLVAGAPATNDPDTATVADVLPAQQDSPRYGSPSTLHAGPPAAADFVYLRDLEPRPVEWLWQDRLACGTLAMISGVPGSGKTWLALAIAALSRGRDPWTCEALEPCTVLYASMEHDSSEIILPRFIALKGNPDRFAVLRRVGSDASASPKLRDTCAIEDALQRTGARLLILDSFDTYFGIDLHQPTETHPLCEKLARLAERQHCCILLLRHLSKRGPGRPAFRGQPEISSALRTEFLAGSSPDARSQLVFL